MPSFYFMNTKFHACNHLLCLYNMDRVGNPDDRFSSDKALFIIFSSFCPAHRPQQDVPSTEDPLYVCPICMTSVECKPSAETLRAPCCRKAWYHRSCVQVSSHGICNIRVAQSDEHHRHCTCWFQCTQKKR